MSIKKKSIFIFFTIFMMLLSSCRNVEEKKNDDNQKVNAFIEQPIVELKEVEQGVLIQWKEISEVEGYYVYKKEQDKQYRRQYRDSASIFRHQRAEAV